MRNRQNQDSLDYPIWGKDRSSKFLPRAHRPACACCCSLRSHHTVSAWLCLEGPRPSSLFPQRALIMLLRGDVEAPAWASWVLLGTAPFWGGTWLAPVLPKVAHSPAPVSLTAPPSCAAALPQLCRPAALTRRVDGVQRHLPGSYEPAHLLQVPLPDVVLEDDIVGEAHGARGPQARGVPATPRHRQGALIPHAAGSLQAQQHGAAQRWARPSLHCWLLFCLSGDLLTTDPCWPRTAALLPRPGCVRVPLLQGSGSHRALQNSLSHMQELAPGTCSSPTGPWPRTDDSLGAPHYKGSPGLFWGHAAHAICHDAS